MNLSTILLIALGLSLDALAVAVASGFAIARVQFRPALRMALFFGGFQAAMPLAGWLAGVRLRHALTGIDHWIAFGLLVAIGGKMIYESTRLEPDGAGADPFSTKVLLFLAVATSVDALAVGLSLSFLGVAILAPAAIIGAVTFALSLAGAYAGRRFGHLFEGKLELAGGIILIAIGAKILLQHLLAS